MFYDWHLANADLRLGSCYFERRTMEACEIMGRLIIIVLVVCGLLFVLEKSGLEDEAKALIHAAFSAGAEATK